VPEFACENEVRWGDMDAFGHVSNVTYLRYIEDCRGAWFSKLLPKWQTTDTGPVVANTNINYRTPIVWPARVRTLLTPAEPGRSSLKLRFEIRDADSEKDTLYADAVVTLVWIDKEKGEPVPLPDPIRAAGA